MIAIHIHFQDGSEMYRTVWRIDIKRDSKQCYIWDIPEQTAPEQIKAAKVDVYAAGIPHVIHTYIL